MSNQESGFNTTKRSGTLLQGKTSQNKAVPASPKTNGKGKEIQNGLGVLGPHDDI